jgi:hypothetical protein
VLVSPNASLELVLGRNLAPGRGPFKRVEHPLPPPHPLPQKCFSKSFPKKKRKQIIFGFDVWLAWWVIKSRGSDDASVHARKQIMADGVDVT